MSAVPHIAVMELRSGRSRAIAIAATGAIAVFGSVAIQGAHSDLLKGLDNAAADMNAVHRRVGVAGGHLQPADDLPVHAHRSSRKLESCRGCARCACTAAACSTTSDRRIWVIAPPREASPLVPPTQLVEGNVAQADARVRAGGWAVVSLALAEEHHLKIGQSLHAALAQPDHVAVAAVSTNIGWAPGAIVMSADDYAKAWGSTDASAYNVLMKPGVSPEQGRARYRPALGSEYGAGGADREQHADKLRAITRQGLAAALADRHADPGRRGDGDGGRDGRHDLAAPPAPGEAQARGLPAPTNCGTRSCLRA